MMLSAIIVLFAGLVNTPGHYAPDYPVVMTPVIPGNHQSHNATREDSRERVDEIIVPDLAIQEAIRIVVAAIEVNDKAAIDTQFSVIADLCNSNKKLILRQFVYYSMMGNKMYDSLVTRFAIKHYDILDVNIVDYLMDFVNSNDGLLKGTVRDIFSGIETDSVSLNRGPDYTTYRSLMQIRRNQHQEMPRNLIQYMYETNPGETVTSLMILTLRKPDERKPILWADHCVDDILWKWKYEFMEKGSVTEETLEALIAVAQSKQWWARMYVAEILRKHPPFRDERILEIMIDETDPSARAILSEFMQLNEVDPNDRNDGEGETEAESKE